MSEHPNLLKSVLIFTNPKGQHNSSLAYQKMDEVQHQTSIYVATENIPAGVAITDARWAKKLDNSTAYQAEQTRQTAEGEREQAEDAREVAEGLRKQGEIDRDNAYSQAETARDGLYGSAESARDSLFDGAQQDRTSAYGLRENQRDDAYDAAELARGGLYEAAESARDGLYENAEAGREQAFEAAESGRVTKDTARTTAEGLRVTAESGRVSAESERVSAETGRVSAESGRVSAESARVTAESGRATKDTARTTAEGLRVTAESGRVSAESERVSAETGRVSAESGRVDAENIRSEFYDGFSSQLADVVQDVNALETTVNRLESKNTHKYGVLWDEVNHQCTRLYDAVNITTNTANFGHFGAVNPSYNNPFDKIYPWSHRKLCNIDVDIYQALPDGADIKDCIIAWEGDPDFKIDGTNGAVMVYTPEFWSAEKAVTGGREFVVADGPVRGFIRCEESIGARWLGVDDGTGGLTSIPGMPIAGVPMSTIHSMATFKDMTLEDIYTWSADNILMYVEYTTLNSQIALGNGVDSLYKQGLRPLVAETGVNRVVLAKADANLFIVGSIIDIGTTDGASNTARRIVTSVTEVDATNSAVNFDGVAVDITTELYVSLHGLSNMADADLKSGSGYIGINGKSNAYYRGRIAHANLFRYVLGAYREKDTGKYWVAKNREDAASVDALNTATHIDTGCTFPYKEDGIAQDEGYIKDMYLYDAIPGHLFVKSVGGSSTNPIGDYLYHPSKSTVNTILVAGGPSSTGAPCGRLYGDWSAAAGYSYWRSSGLPFLKNP